MPIYDYRCKDCSGDFEISRSMNDPSTDVKCPNCKSKNVGRYYGTISLGSAQSGHSHNCGSCSSGVCSSCSSKG